MKRKSVEDRPDESKLGPSDPDLPWNPLARENARDWAQQQQQSHRPVKRPRGVYRRLGATEEGRKYLSNVPFPEQPPTLPPAEPFPFHSDPHREIPSGMASARDDTNPNLELPHGPSSTELQPATTEPFSLRNQPVQMNLGAQQKTIHPSMFSSSRRSEAASNLSKRPATVLGTSKTSRILREKRRTRFGSQPTGRSDFGTSFNGPICNAPTPTGLPTNLFALGNLDQKMQEKDQSSSFTLQGNFGQQSSSSPSFKSDIGIGSEHAFTFSAPLPALSLSRQPLSAGLGDQTSAPTSRDGSMMSIFGQVSALSEVGQSQIPNETHPRSQEPSSSAIHGTQQVPHDSALDEPRKDDGNSNTMQKNTDSSVAQAQMQPFTYDTMPPQAIIHPSEVGSSCQMLIDSPNLKNSSTLSHLQSPKINPNFSAYASNTSTNNAPTHQPQKSCQKSVAGLANVEANHISYQQANPSMTPYSSSHERHVHFNVDSASYKQSSVGRKRKSDDIGGAKLYSNNHTNASRSKQLASTPWNIFKSSETPAARETISQMFFRPSDIRDVAPALANWLLQEESITDQAREHFNQMQRGSWTGYPEDVRQRFFQVMLSVQRMPLEEIFSTPNAQKDLSAYGLVQVFRDALVVFKKILEDGKTETVRLEDGGEDAALELLNRLLVGASHWIQLEGLVPAGPKEGTRQGSGLSAKEYLERLRVLKG